MRLISSRDAVDFLAHAAPRPWVQRLLRWMAFDEGLAAYSRKGTVQAYCSVADVTRELIEKAGELSGTRMDAVIREEFDEELAAKLVGKDPFSRFDDEPVSWDEAGEPMQLDIGFFLFASEIDFDEGVLTASYLPNDGDLREVFFYQSDLLASQFERADFEAHIQGLSFEFRSIEMLLPSLELTSKPNSRTMQPEWRKQVGRPPKWDWEGALAHVVAQAQTPDGLPTGQGAQARIEEMISGWFIDQTGESPAASLVRSRASKVIRTLEKPL